MNFLANGTVGGLAFFSLILSVTVIVFGIKFLLDRNAPETPSEPREEEEKPAQTEESPSPPLYVIREAKKPVRKRKPQPKKPSEPPLRPDMLFRIERVEQPETAHKES